MAAVPVDSLLRWKEKSTNIYGDIDEDDQLRLAVKLNDLGKVVELLSAGGNPNLCEPDCNEDRLLHFIQGVEVARVLLFRGADVNACNANNESPLHTVIKNLGSLETVKVLLKHGAEVNCTNCRGETALSLTLKPKFYHQYEVSVLATAFRRRPSIRDFIIKYCILFNFERNYLEIMDFTSFENEPNIGLVLEFIEDCICEINRMKSEVLGNRSVYSLVTTKDDLTVLYPSSEFVNNDFASTYPIYSDIIADTVEVFLRRGELLYALQETGVFTMCVCSEGVAQKITLDCDSVMIVAQYLSNDDLSNLFKALKVSDACCVSEFEGGA